MNLLKNCLEEALNARNWLSTSLLTKRYLYIATHHYRYYQQLFLIIRIFCSRVVFLFNLVLKGNYWYIELNKFRY